MTRRLQLALFLALMVCIFLTQVAATGVATALAIAAVVGGVSPFILKYLNLNGAAMTTLTLVLSIAIGVIAELVSGEVKLNDLGSNTSALLAAVTLCYTAMQAVYNYFKDHPLGPLKVA